MPAQNNALRVLISALFFAYPVAASAEPVPADPDRFLTFFNSVAAEHREDSTSALFYYLAIDPMGSKTTLADWLIANDLDSATDPDAEAIYVNDVDLGFGRHMYIKTLPDGRVASYVENFGDNGVTGDPVDGPSQEKIANAHNGVNLIATVAMEYGPPPNDPLGEKYTTFYVFGPDGQRLLAADLDGRGAKSVPGACNICHGGAPRPLLADNQYPDNGDTGANFLPWDLDSFGYSNEVFGGGQPYTRVAQEAAFKALNSAVLQTNPPPAVREVVEGWYGGPGLPSATFNGEFVPAGWVGREATYLNAFAPNCRACHVTRNPAVAFTSYQQLFDLQARAQHLVFDRGVMPLARRTYDRFWPDFSAADPDFVDLLGAVPATRRPALGPTITYAGVDAAAIVGVPYQLDASHTLYALAFNWVVQEAPPGSVATVSDPASPTPTFTPDLPGAYRLQLAGANTLGGLFDDVNLVATIGVLGFEGTQTGIEFETDIVPIIAEHCISCHTAPINGGVAPPFDEPVISSVYETAYRQLSLRVNVQEPAKSLLLLKPTGQVNHGGGVTLSGEDQDRLTAWIAQGALRTLDADDDGLDDRLEPALGTNIVNPDTDGDTFFDSVEVIYGSSPVSGLDVPDEPLLLSIDRTGWRGNGQSSAAAVSPDGRYVAFQSSAGNLVPAPVFSGLNIFVKDKLAGYIAEADVDDGGFGTGSSLYPAISADGRYVAYASLASKLVPFDTNNVQDVFVTDMQTGSITRVSTDSGGFQVPGASGFDSIGISDDGVLVVFASDEINFVPGDTNQATDIFVKDRFSGAISRVSTNAANEQADGSSLSPRISADGRFVAFASFATNLVPEATGPGLNIFVKDTLTGAVKYASTDSNGVAANLPSYAPRISANGGHVVFMSDADNLVPGDSNVSRDVFVKDLDSGVTTRVNVDNNGNQSSTTSFLSLPTISADGRYVAFTSTSATLVPGDTNGQPDIFVRDLVENATVRVSLAPGGAQSNGLSSTPAISADGRTVTFHSSATNLASGNVGFNDIYQVTNPLFPVDFDGDGVVDGSDNCLYQPNGDQRDTNGDGFGNLCDADLNNDNIINAVDLGLFRSQFFMTGDIDADFNGDMVVNALDLGILKASFFGAPGPSGIAP